jgi:hypothetical protein
MLRAEAKEPVEAKLNVEEGQQRSVIAATVKPGAYRWVDFKLQEPMTPGKVYFVWLPVTRDLYWRVARGGDAQRTWGKPGAWTTVHGSYMIKPCGTPRALGRVGPEMAIDGVAWPSEGQCHQWRSDPGKGLPQWLEVDFGKTAPLNMVYLTFDTNIFGRFPARKPGTEVTAQDYRLLYSDGGQFKLAFSEQGNWRRFRRHQFSDITTDKIRLEILNAVNGNEARLYEIRAYKE